MKIHVWQKIMNFLKVYQNIDEICFKKISKYYYVHESLDEFDIKIKDIISQIEIQMKARKFLEKNGCFSEYDKTIMERKVTDLIYTYIIGGLVDSYREFLIYIAPIKKFSNLIIKGGNPYRDILLYALSNDKNFIVYLLLWMRQKLKRLRKGE